MLEINDTFELVYAKKGAFDYPVGTLFTVTGAHPLGAICVMEGCTEPLVFAGYTGSMGVCVYQTHDGWQYVHPADAQVLAYFRIVNREWIPATA